jgi:SPP1 family predicted phage head-tail adaptor
MTSGEMRELFELQEPSIVDTKGEDTVTWPTVAGASAVRAHIREEKEYERVRAGRNEARESIIVTTRKDLTVTPENRILWRGSVYQVVGFPQYVGVRRLWIRFAAIQTDAD